MQERVNADARHGVRAKCDGLKAPRIAAGPHHRFRVSSPASSLAWLVYGSLALALLVLHAVGGQ